MSTPHSVDPQMESLVKQFTASALDRCVHFTGVQNVTCEAGIAYESVVVKHEPMSGYNLSRPCNTKLNHCGATCAASKFPTAEEALAAAEVKAAALLDSIKYTGDARRRILAQTNNRGGAGTVECPKCGGRLHYGQASTNKHIHAHCETPKCLSWME